MKAPDVTYVRRRKAPFERLKRELTAGSGGMLSQEIFEKRTPRIVSSASGNQVSVSQARLDFTQILFGRPLSLSPSCVTGFHADIFFSRFSLASRTTD